MSSDEKRIWGIHTMDDQLFLKNSVIAIGWRAIGDLSIIAPTRDAFKEKYAEAYPDENKMKMAISAGMLYRFVHEIQINVTA